MSLSAYVLPWPGTSILMRYDCVKDLSFIKCNPRRYFPWAATPPLRISFFCVFVIQRIHCCCLHVHGSLERGSKALCSSHLIWKVFFCKSTHSEVLRKSKQALCARSKQVKMSRTSGLYLAVSWARTSAMLTTRRTNLSLQQTTLSVNNERLFVWLCVIHINGNFKRIDLGPRGGSSGWGTVLVPAVAVSTAGLTHNQQRHPPELGSVRLAGIPIASLYSDSYWPSQCLRERLLSST